MNVLARPEAKEAIRVLSFDGGDWREIHRAIQGGLEIPDIVIELKHASDLLAAIERGDEDAMTTALLDMRGALLETEKEAHRDTRLKVEELRRVLEAVQPLAREGFNVRKGRKKSERETEERKRPGRIRENAGGGGQASKGAPRLGQDAGL